MFGELFAILSALFWACAVVTLRRALQTNNALTVTFVSVLSNTLYFWPAAVFLTPWDRVGYDGLLPLIAGGLLAPAFGRILWVMAVDKLGAARSAPLFETTPLFSVLFAVSFLGEAVNLQIGLGLLAIVSGVMVLSLGHGKLMLSRAGVVISLVSAAAFGGAANLYRVGAISVNSPILGAAIGVSMASILYLVLSVISKKPIDNPRKWSRFTYLNGVFTGLALSSMWTALFLQKVVIVAPLFSITPVFTLLLSWIFLRKLEKLSFIIIAAAFLVILGSVFVVTA